LSLAARACPTAVGLLLTLLVSVASTVAEQEPGAPSLEVIGTLFRVTTSSGRVLTSPDLIGAVLDAVDEAGRSITVRIDAVTRDPSDGEGDVWLHRFSTLDGKTGRWRGSCTPGPDDTVAGFPLTGRWTADGRHLRTASTFTLTCTSGAAGKCVRLGYKPWREDASGESLWDYHQACVRMVRADYGGDGTGYTREGTRIDVSDRLSIQQPERDPGGLTFEAAWGPEGAICVRRTRIPDLSSTDELARRYPRLAKRIGPDCSAATPALIWNRS
jgi:ADYC domain-containing protein